MRHACICTLLGLLTAGAVTTASAQTFDPSTPLNANAATDTGGDTFPQMATDGLGTWVAVWRSNDPLGGPAGTDWDIFFARSVDDGATWSAPAVLNSYGIGDSGIDHSPQVVTDDGLVTLKRIDVANNRIGLQLQTTDTELTGL